MVLLIILAVATLLVALGCYVVYSPPSNRTSERLPPRPIPPPPDPPMPPDSYKGWLKSARISGPSTVDLVVDTNDGEVVYVIHIRKPKGVK